jgi:hypothetical protein
MDLEVKKGKFDGFLTACFLKEPLTAP